MPNDTLLNGRSPVTQKSNGTVITAPDVCKTPSPGGPIPIPYVNIAKSADLAKGSATVQINGASVCLESSELSKSIGDEAGTAKGVISGTVSDRATPMTFSSDVKIEGKGVVRNGDVFVGNDGNTPPGPIMQAQVAPSAPAKAEEDKCPYCKKAEHDFAKRPGSHIGSGQILRKNIIPNVATHRWYCEQGSLHAHHLICSEAMRDDKWPKWCTEFGYNINAKENGVMLPHTMPLACQLHAPLHRGCHSHGKAEGTTYPKKVKSDLLDFARKIEAGDYCSNPSKLSDDLNKYSELVLSKLSKFKWTLTSDGKDYKQGGKGCAGARNIKAKTSSDCPHNRNHKLTRKACRSLLTAHTGPLTIGA